MEQQLKEVGSTALMDYFLHFWQTDEEGKHLKSASWKDICQLFEFNEKFIGLLKTAGDRVEMAFREQVAYQMEQAFGSYWHYDENLFKAPCEKNLQDGRKATHSAYLEIQKFTGVYFKQQGEYPFRYIMFKINFRQMFHMYTCLRPCPAKERIAEALGIPHVATFESSMYAIEELRNFYSHLNPMWAKRYKEIRYCLRYPLYYDWLKSPAVRSNSIYYRLCLLNYILQRIGSDYELSPLLHKLLKKYKKVVPLPEMGFTEDWEEESMWKCK